MTRFPPNDIISLVGQAPRYDLAESLGPDLRLADLLEGSVGLGDMPLAYGSTAGERWLRQAVAERHGVSADDVVVTVGGMHALFLIAFILCERGSEVVTTSPSFPLTGNTLTAVGATQRIRPLAFDRGYRLDAADLVPLLSKATKLVCLASPQNPSGVAIPPVALRDILAAMAAACPEAYLLVDETYREAVYGDAAVVETAVTLGAKVISVASLSKCHGAPGLRLGWAVTREAALREQLLLAKFNTVISCSPLEEALALRLLEREGLMNERRRHLAESLAATAQWVRKNGDMLDWVRPDAGAICCLRLKPAIFDEPAVARFYDALAGEGVRVAPGSWFGEKDRVFRLGFGLMSAADLQAALAGLARAARQAALRAA